MDADKSQEYAQTGQQKILLEMLLVKNPEYKATSTQYN